MNSKQVNEAVIVLGGLAREALDVARKRTAILDEMRKALLEGRDDEALLLARRLCGLRPDERAPVKRSRKINRP